MVKPGFKVIRSYSCPLHPKRTTRARSVRCHKLNSLVAFDVLRQLVECLITELDRAEPDSGVALRLRWMQLPHRDDCLAVALLIERDGHAEYARIVVFVGAMIDLDKVRPLDLQELHPIRISRSVWRNHIEPPFAVDSNIY
jgi:hypothetical protein